MSYDLDNEDEAEDVSFDRTSVPPVRLSSPLSIGDSKEIDEIKMRFPNAGDLARAGTPIKIELENENEVIQPVPANLLKLISILTGINTVFLKKMDARDFTACQTALLPFISGS